MGKVKVKAKDKDGIEIDKELDVSTDVEAQILATQELTKAMGRLAAIGRII
jgi:hypothetical protein